RCMFAAMSPLLLAGCSSSGPGSADPASHAARAKPSQVIAGPRQLLAGTTPQLNGQLWLLSGSPTTKTLQTVSLVGGKLGHPVPISASATSIVQSASGTMA